jgi:hypothetical protein
VARAPQVGSRASIPRRVDWRVPSGAPRASLDSGPIRILSDVRALADMLVQAGADAVADAVERRLVPAAEAARAGWPVLTGYSRERVGMGVEPIGTLLRVLVVNTAWYSGWIKQNRVPALTAERLLFEPVQAAAERMAEDIADQIARGAP